ncbi:hypothetical protein SLS62_010768 [Diatrype stigma]|uniref:F-box domain-containing protein n=1 Tax=Diatrype stigma TaxID=117547 RepID=A0AAN9U8B4_9PEZI
MELLPSELMLEIAGHLDVNSMKNFMMSNKDVQALIKTHERSISDAKVAGFYMPPAGNVLSSSTIERHVLRGGTLNMAAELERRARRADELFDDRRALATDGDPAKAAATPGFFEAGGRSWTFYGWTDAQRGRHQALVRRGLGLCERIADVAANAPCTAPAPERWAEITAVDDPWDLPEEALPEEQGGSYPDPDPFLNPDARPHQLALVRALPADDVLALFYFIAGCGEAYSYKNADVQSDPVAVERITVFEECVLRHGSYFLWSHVHGPSRSNLKRMSKVMIKAGLHELTTWESGKPGLQPGLRMTLIGRFREVCPPKDDDEGRQNVTDRMYGMVNDLIFARDGEKKKGAAEEEGAADAETDDETDSEMDSEADTET